MNHGFMDEKLQKNPMSHELQITIFPQQMIKLPQTKHQSSKLLINLQSAITTTLFQT